MNQNIEELQLELMKNSNANENHCAELATRYHRYATRHKNQKDSLWGSNVELVLREIQEICNEESIENLASYRGIRAEDCVTRL